LGLPDGRTSTLPNFVPEARVATHSRAEDGEYALVAGRLVEEKGFDTAIAAAVAADVPLVIAGEGPDEPRLRRLAAGADVRFTGWLHPVALNEVRARAALVLAPSRCEEACGYSALEGLAAGVPALVSDRGGLPELVTGGDVLPAEDPGAWTRALAELWRDPAARRERGEQALGRARARYGEDAYYERLIEIYGA
jgi:glycosyltransferase involved in cell wall biosynthesis